MNLMIEKIIYMIKVVTILSLCIGFANATGSGITNESLVSAKYTGTVEILTALVVQSNQTAAIVRPSVNTTLLPTIQNELAELNVPENIIDTAIAAQEKKLTQNPLIINDSVDATQEFHGFFVSNDTTSPAQNTYQEGFILHGSDGITRVFSSEGKELFFVVDSRTEKFQSPSGVEKPVSYSIAVPIGTIIVIKNNITYVTYDGRILFTIFDDKLSSLSSSGSDSPDQEGLSWVEYAESNTPSSFGVFSSLWNIPHSPDLPFTHTNILFNGIESGYPGQMYIIQPVTAFNFKSNCNNMTDCVWENVWTGSAWCVYGPNSSDFHTYPPVNFSELDPAWGYVIWDNSNSDYIIYIMNERTNDWAGIGIIGLSLNPQYQQAVVAYEAWPKIPIIFHDNQKINSTVFTQMWAEDMQNNPISLNWIPSVNPGGHPLITGLNVDLSHSPSTVILETDYRGSKIGVFRPSTHVFYEDINGNGVWQGALTDRSYNFGIAGDLAVTGDWNGDERTEIGVYRPSTHLYYQDYNGNGAWDGAITDRSYNFGITGDIPVSGDWNADGITEMGIYRPSTWEFYLDYNGNGVWNGATTDRRYVFGMIGDQPITGDWNADGITEIGIFRPSTHLFYLDYNGNGAWDGAVTDRQYDFGITDDIPVTGDWNNNGITEIGVYRPSTHLYYQDYNGNGAWDGAITDRSYNFGITGDIPISGKWV